MQEAKSRSFEDVVKVKRDSIRTINDTRLPMDPILHRNFSIAIEQSKRIKWEKEREFYAP